MDIHQYIEGLPKWAKIGIPLGIVGVFVLGRLRSKTGAVSANQTDSQNLQNAQTDYQNQQQNNQLVDAFAQLTQQQTDALKASQQQTADMLDAVTKGITSQVSDSLNTSLTSFQDDLMKQESQTASQLAGFQSQLTSILNAQQLAASGVDHHDAVTTLASSSSFSSSPVVSNPSSGFVSQHTDNTGLGNAASIHQDGSVTSNINGTTVAGNYNNVDSHDHVEWAPNIGTFVWNDQSGIALPPGATARN